MYIMDCQTLTDSDILTGINR